MFGNSTKVNKSQNPLITKKIRWLHHLRGGANPPPYPGISETLSNLEPIHLAPRMFFFSVAKVDVMEGLLCSNSSEKETECQAHVCVCEPLFACFL